MKGEIRFLAPHFFNYAARSDRGDTGGIESVKVSNPTDKVREK